MNELGGTSEESVVVMQARVNTLVWGSGHEDEEEE